MQTLAALAIILSILIFAFAQHIIHWIWRKTWKKNDHFAQFCLIILDILCIIAMCRVIFYAIDVI